MWLILLGAGLFLAADIYILYHLRLIAAGPMSVMWTIMLAIVIAATVMYAIVLFYAFPLLASVANTIKAMLKNSFLIGTHYLFCTIMIFVIHFAMFFVIVRFFTPLIIAGEGLSALLSSKLLFRVIDACSYDPDEQDDPGEEGKE